MVNILIVELFILLKSVILKRKFKNASAGLFAEDFKITEIDWQLRARWWMIVL